ncbi:modification methylase [Candidatus Epulonipiscioides saccharophilum]|nr:modification methylase [Epulopiscium sp. SCG-B10WGA-EpuloB]
MNYIGSKYSLLDFLVNIIEEVAQVEDRENLVFGDLFAGTGIVGSKFKKMGYKVIANDIQHYSYVINKHYIENNQPLQKDLVEYFNSLEGIEGFIYNNYSLGSGSQRNYFTDYNAKKCDRIRIELESLYRQELISKATYYYYLASLINSIDRLANTTSVYGSFLKHIKKTAAKELKLELVPVIEGTNIGKVYNKNINDLILDLSGDILYLDPPYNARQYSANYHLLETISKYDNPDIQGKTGLRKDYIKSSYCSKKRVKADFEHIIKNANFKHIFLSYNNEGLMSIDDIERIMRKYGQYEVFTKPYKRFRADNELTRKHKAKMTVEYLHCLVK